ncbi:MAG: 16S rRNA (guanine(527)-N(7))-methyltransferase RsmG [Spirochaetales bacterium]|jgi:16S rRNA (guanine527-N7)-methyltransferase|nr:16S rRNA (guanine(527)-N(7))-methyltransferase RsmG [Spirochaetales bacterium]
MNAPQTLLRGLETLGIQADAADAGKLETYMAELEKWNPLFGLVSAGGSSSPGAMRERLIVRHVLDSLAGLPFIREILNGMREDCLADVGSGAGLPGIPLAVFLPQTRVTLIEPSRKRCAFLRSAAALMNLKNLRVFEGELAAARETFSLVTCRAFRPLDRKTLKALLAVTRPGGVIAAYKATEEKTLAETAEARALGLQARAQPLMVPGLNEERRLLVISRAGESAGQQDEEKE